MAFSMFAYLALISFDILLVSGSLENLWGYKYNDGIPPQNWPMLYPTCGESRQSPINIDTTNVVLDEDLQPFDFRGVQTIDKSVMTLINHGKTVEIDLEGKSQFMYGDGLKGGFKVKQFHFHWGTDDRHGSEHDFNGLQYPMEMHMVTHDPQHDFHTAMNSSRGLAVMAFFIDIGEEDHPYFEEIITSFASIIRWDDNATLTSFPFRELLPKQCDVYYRYYGSLTTPPCYESVVWNVFQTPIKISKRQILKFRLLGSRHINKFRDIADNYRDIQPLNGRFVFTNDIRGILPSQQPKPSKQMISENSNSTSNTNQGGQGNERSQTQPGNNGNLRSNNLVNHHINTNQGGQGNERSQTQPRNNGNSGSNNLVDHLISSRPNFRIQSEQHNNVPSNTNLRLNVDGRSLTNQGSNAKSGSHTLVQNLINTRPFFRIESKRNNNQDNTVGPLISQLSQKIKAELNQSNRYPGSSKGKYSTRSKKIHLFKKPRNLYVTKPKNRYYVINKSPLKINKNNKGYQRYSQSYGRRIISPGYK